MQQEPHFSDWLEHTTDPVALLDGVTVETLRLRQWNAAFAALMGIRDKTSADQDLATALARSRPMDPGRRAQARAEFEHSNRSALEHGRHLARWEFLQPDGTPLQAEVELIAMPSVGAEAFCAHIRDISQLEATRQELKDTLMRYQALFEGANDAIGLARIEQDKPVFFSANRALAEVYGAVSTDQLLGKNPATFAPPLQADGTPSTERAAAAVREMIEHGVARLEWQASRLDGQPITLEVVLSPQPLWGEHVLQFAVRDISPLKIALARFHELFEAASDGCGFVAILDGTTPAFLNCNAALCRLYGAQDKNQLIGRPPTDFAAPTQPDGRPSAELAQSVVEQALRDGHARFEWLGKRLDGSEFWMDVTLTAQPSWGAGAVHFSGRDVTERKQGEVALSRAEELARITLQSIGDGVITTDDQARGPA